MAEISSPATVPFTLVVLTIVATFRLSAGSSPRYSSPPPRNTHPNNTPNQTEAKNNVLKEKEGLSVLLLGGGKEVLFRDALASPEGEKVLVGEYAARWPLVKILDIGGATSCILDSLDTLLSLSKARFHPSRFM